MALTATLGAPSLAGRGANNEQPSIAGFAGAAYPLKVRFTNLMPRELALPEVDLTLGHCAGSDRTASATVTRYETLRGLAARIGQISELNAYAAALTLEEVEAESIESDRPAKPLKIKESQK